MAETGDAGEALAGGLSPYAKGLGAAFGAAM